MLGKKTSVIGNGCRNTINKNVTGHKIIVVPPEGSGSTSCSEEGGRAHFHL